MCEQGEYKSNEYYENKNFNILKEVVQQQYEYEESRKNIIENKINTLITTTVGVLGLSVFLTFHQLIIILEAYMRF